MKRLIILIIAAAAAFAYCSREQKKEETTLPEGSPAYEFISSVSSLSNVNGINWDSIPEVSRDLFEYNEKTLRCIDSLGLPAFIPDELKDNCERLKSYVHTKGMALRSVSSNEVDAALDRFEASFDTLFDRCVSQEYYLRLFRDCYDETIPQALDSLISTLQKLSTADPKSGGDEESLKNGNR